MLVTTVGLRLSLLCCLERYGLPYADWRGGGEGGGGVGGGAWGGGSRGAGGGQGGEEGTEPQSDQQSLPQTSSTVTDNNICEARAQRIDTSLLLRKQPTVS